MDDNHGAVDSLRAAVKAVTEPVAEAVVTTAPATRETSDRLDRMSDRLSEFREHSFTREDWDAKIQPFESRVSHIERDYAPRAAVDYMAEKIDKFVSREELDTKFEAQSLQIKVVDSKIETLTTSVNSPQGGVINRLATVEKRAFPAYVIGFVSTLIGSLITWGITHVVTMFFH